MKQEDIEMIGQFATIVKIAVVILLQVVTLAILVRRVQVQKMSQDGDQSFKKYRRSAEAGHSGKGRKGPKQNDPHHAWEDKVPSGHYAHA